MSEIVPHLLEKFEALLQSARRPDIATVEQLRLELQISKSGLRKATTHPVHKDRISVKFIERICRAFALSRKTLFMENLEEFREYIRNPDSVMEELVNEAITDKSRLKVVLREQRSVSPVIFNHTFDGEYYKVNQQFSVHLQGLPDWSALLILKDPTGWDVLENDNFLTLPEQPNGLSKIKTRMYRFDPPIGEHILLAILTVEPIDTRIINRIRKSTTSEKFEGILELSKYLSHKEENELFHHTFKIIW